MVKMCIPVVIAFLGGASIVTLGVLDSLMIAGEQAVAQNETSQDDKVSRSSNNVSEIYTGTGNNALNSEVLSIVEPSMISHSSLLIWSYYL